jgi:hypothetical protein
MPQLKLVGRLLITLRIHETALTDNCSFYDPTHNKRIFRVSLIFLEKIKRTICFTINAHISNKKSVPICANDYAVRLKQFDAI